MLTHENFSCDNIYVHGAQPYSDIQWKVLIPSGA